MKKISEDKLAVSMEQASIKLAMETAGAYYDAAKSILEGTGATEIIGQWNDPLYWGQTLIMVLLEEMRALDDNKTLPDVIAHNVGLMIEATKEGRRLYSVAMPEGQSLQ